MGDDQPPGTVDRSDAVDRLADTADDLTDKAEDAGRRFEWIGRAGWLAKGLVYALVGVLFLRIAWTGGRGDEASQAGAIELLADTPFGSVLLVALGIGLALYVAWRFFSVVMPGDWTGGALINRIGYAVSAITYAGLLATTIGFLRSRGGDGGGSEDRTVEGLVKEVLAVPAGRIIVVLAGIAVIGIGVAFARKGWTRSFREQISGDYGLEGTLIDRLGTIGWIARGVSMGIIGFFLARAAWLHDPDEAAGLDDSIRQIVGHPLGRAMAVAVGLGFVAFGVFAALSARYRDLKGPTND